MKIGREYAALLVTRQNNLTEKPNHLSDTSESWSSQGRQVDLRLPISVLITSQRPETGSFPLHLSSLSILFKAKNQTWQTHLPLAEASLMLDVRLSHVKHEPLGLSQMPHEIKLEICEFFCNHCCAGWKGPSERQPRPSWTLLNLCLTSQSMRAAAQPVLFHAAFTSGLYKPIARYHALAKAVEENPHLARAVKSLSADCAICDTETIMKHASCLEELEVLVDASTNWASAFVFPRVRQLKLKHVGRNTQRIFSGFQSRRLLENLPQLAKLTLTSLLRFEEPLGDALATVQELVLDLKMEQEEFVSSEIRILAQAMPQLRCFSIISTHMGYRSEAAIRKVLEPLLVRKDELRSITIDHNRLPLGDLDHLKHFSKLEYLYLVASATPPHALEQLDTPEPLVLPQSLRELNFCNSARWPLPEFWDLVQSLQYELCLGLYPNLERFHGGPRTSPLTDVPRDILTSRNIR
ncbi:hypothetical protein B0T10DRAFT_546707 [Thelonectria olida]|uniref:Uncharacterized protein n=1 Tax=Thelonectria olida TaxID=1576542 RepID=A0A9P9AT28_9HYPO|nr:hypothetical protein B0T10DRAFT_546707 [Thelonectria olida]